MNRVRNKTNNRIVEFCVFYITENWTFLIVIDSNGNILSKVFYPYTTGTLTSATSTISYTYNSTWGDQLLTYNGGSTITYDAIGNPLSYNGMTFTWQKGRQLASANNGTQTFQFTYDQDGNRTWKMGSTTGEQCIYASGLLVYWTDGENEQKFTYDPDGIALGVNLNGTDYYYLYNAQGDVIALYDSTGTIVVEYVYDSWGKLLSTTGSGASTIGFLNPLRYRGYFYDTDLSLYLLETRYYDPETGRFINADGVVDNRNLGNMNLYSYCANDPVDCRDEDGFSVKRILAGAAVGAVYGLVKGIKNNKKGQPNRGLNIVRSTVSGLVAGVVIAKAGVKAIKKFKNKKVGNATVSGVTQGGQSFWGHYSSRTKKAVKKYIKKVDDAATYRPPNQRNPKYRSSYDEIKVYTSNLKKDLKPTKGDVMAGAVGTTLGLAEAWQSGKLEAAYDSGEVGRITDYIMTFLITGETKAFSEGINELVQALYPGE